MNLCSLPFYGVFEISKLLPLLYNIIKNSGEVKFKLDFINCLGDFECL